MTEFETYAHPDQCWAWGLLTAEGDAVEGLFTDAELDAAESAGGRDRDICGADAAYVAWLTSRFSDDVIELCPEHLARLREHHSNDVLRAVSRRRAA